MTDPIDPGVLEAILATADAEDDEGRRDVWDGYAFGGHRDLAQVVSRAGRAIVAAEYIVTRERWRAGPEGTWLFRDGEEI